MGKTTLMFSAHVDGAKDGPWRVSCLQALSDLRGASFRWRQDDGLSTVLGDDGVPTMILVCAFDKELIGK